MKKTKVLFFFVGLLIYSAVFADDYESESASGYLTSLPPNAPVLYSPADEAVQVSDKSNLIWHSQDYTASYRLQVSAISDFSTLLLNESDLTDTLFSVSIFETSTTYYWRVCGINEADQGEYSQVWRFTTSSISPVEENNHSIPKHYALLLAYPNPFNPVTHIRYQLPEKADVSLHIYNNRGQLVRELVSGPRQSGEYKVAWDGLDDHGVPVTSGLYLCHLNTDGRVFTQKIMLTR